MPRTPTLSQRFWANRWLWPGWLGAWSVLALVRLMKEINDTPWYGWSWLWLLLLVPFTMLIGVLVGGVLGTFVLGPIFSSRGFKNGGPFRVGDTVQILNGPYKGKVTQVYQIGQHESVRLRLGEEEEKSFKDIFADVELLRETPAFQADSTSDSAE